MAEEGSGGSPWIWYEDEEFENDEGYQYLISDGIGHGDDGFPAKIAEDLPRKSIGEVKEHYYYHRWPWESLGNIDAYLFPLPDYVHPSESFATKMCRGSDGDDDGVVKESRSSEDGGSGKRCRGSDPDNDGVVKRLRSSQVKEPRRKGDPWSEAEHAFIAGLETYGKGDWRSISRNFVKTRTPTQVASHAQKYYLRLNSVDKERRRSSIHDKTTLSPEDRLAMQGIITGDANRPTITSNKLVRHSFQPQPQSLPLPLPLPLPQPGPSGFDTYGTMIGHPFDALVSTVGTPVNCSAPVGPHQANMMQTPPASWNVGTVAPPNVFPLPYSMPYGYSDFPLTYSFPSPLL